MLEYELPKYDGDLGTPNVFVALTEEQFAALAIKHNAAIGDTAHLEADLARHVRLDETSDNLSARILSGEHKVHSHCTGLLCNTCN